MPKFINIAIDGPGGSGKSTLAKALAKHFNYIYIDTGALYRTVGLFILRKGLASEDTNGIIASLPEISIKMILENSGGVIYLNGERMGDEIRTPIASIYGSIVSKIPHVRDFLLETQLSIARGNNCIMDGRDIGTVILPDADVKIFLTACDNDRAARRYKDLLHKRINVTLDEVKKDMRWRDENDRNRQTAPAVPAPDAIILDNSGFMCEDTFAKAMEIIENKLKSR